MLFMWEYQEHFRDQLERDCHHRLSRVAPDLAPRALLIGVLIPGSSDKPACIEPEKGDFPVSVLEHIEERVEELMGTHHLQGVMSVDPRRNRDIPARIRSDAIRSAVQERLKQHADSLGMTGFCGPPADVGNYSVVPAIVVSRERLDTYPRLSVSRALLSNSPLPASLPEAVIECALFDARKKLSEEEPGYYHKDTEDLVPVLREAGRRFMRIPSVAVQGDYADRDLFDNCNDLAALRYESTSTAGQFLIAAKDHPSIEWGVRFRKPVPLRSPRWSRKVLQMAAEDIYPVTNGSVLFGLGRLLANEYDPTREDAFLVSFVDSQTWELWHAGALLMRTAYGVPGLPPKALSAEAFCANLRRVVPETTESSTARIWSIVAKARDARHGSLLVVSADAEAEAARLSHQATSIEPVAVAPEMVASLTSIDGAVLLDAEGRCHAIGVILDGLASQDGTPERGARYNSALRYQESHASVLAVVISEDGMFNVIPTLRSQVRRDYVARHVDAISALLVQPDLDAMRNEVNWLDEHRFYLDQAQCEQANLLVARFYEVCNKALVVCIQYQEFAPNPAMNESFFVAER